VRIRVEVACASLGERVPPRLRNQPGNCGRVGDSAGKPTGVPGRIEVAGAFSQYLPPELGRSRPSPRCSASNARLRPRQMPIDPHIHAGKIPQAAATSGCVSNLPPPRRHGCACDRASRGEQEFGILRKDDQAFTAGGQCRLRLSQQLVRSGNQGIELARESSPSPPSRPSCGRK